MAIAKPVFSRPHQRNMIHKWQIAGEPMTQFSQTRGAVTSNEAQRRSPTRFGLYLSDVKYQSKVSWNAPRRLHNVVVNMVDGGIQWNSRPMSVWMICNRPHALNYLSVIAKARPLLKTWNCCMCGSWSRAKFAAISTNLSHSSRWLTSRESKRHRFLDPLVGMHFLISSSHPSGHLYLWAVCEHH